MRKVAVLKGDYAQIVFYKAKRAKIFANRLILAHVDCDEYISLSPAGGGVHVLEEFGVKGSSREISDPDKLGVPPKVLKGLLELQDMPSLTDFEDLVDRADAIAGEVRDTPFIQKDSSVPKERRKASEKRVLAIPTKRGGQGGAGGEG